MNRISVLVLKRSAIPLLAAMLAGCASFPNTDIEFHELAVQQNLRQNKDKSFDLPFNAYVIGVEKANSSIIGTIRECETSQQGDRCLNINSNYYARNERLKKEIQEIYTEQHRPTFVSHVARFSTNAASNPCYIYNIYDQSNSCGNTKNEIPQKGQYVSRSWDVLLNLGSSISRDIQDNKPTHFLVYFMGWNTPQWEAVKNYRDLFSSLAAAAKESKGTTSFRPLFLGITWPSTGKPIVTAADFGVKAKDADEVGLVWGNLVINRVLSELKAKYGIPIVVVGHSFGARASSRAVFSAPLITDKLSTQNTNLLLGLQGAYSFQRYVPKKGEEGAPYSDFSKFVGKAVLTSSTFDTAVTKAFHEEHFVGSADVYEKTKNPEFSTYFEHARTNDKGLVDITSCEPTKVGFVDASSIINKNQPGTGGGAHSFIYGTEVGRLTLQFIAACTTPKKKAQ